MSQENSYICSSCHQTFDKGWTDADANAEAHQQFGVPNSSHNPHMAVVCDDCYKRIMGAAHS